MSGTLDQVLAAIVRLDERVVHMDARIGRLEDQTNGVREELTRLRVEVMSRLDRQQDTLTRIKDDINVNVAATDNVRERHTQIRNDYDQLAHQVSLVHRRLMQLEQRFDSKEHGA